MAETTLYCETCHKIVVTIKDGKFRNGVVCYCSNCQPKKPKPIETPDFLQQLFSGKRMF